MLYHSSFNLDIWVKILFQDVNDFPVSSEKADFAIRVEIPFEVTLGVCTGKIWLCPVTEYKINHLKVA